MKTIYLTGGVALRVSPSIDLVDRHLQAQVHVGRTPAYMSRLWRNKTYIDTLLDNTHTIMYDEDRALLIDTRT